MKGPLTFAKIKSLKEPGFYGDGGTLYLRIAPGGSKQWVQRLVIRGRRHDLGLGGWPLVSLQEARETAFENRKQARRGEDLLAAKQREAAPTFEEAVEKVIALHQPTWKDGGRTADSWRACLKQYAMPKIGRKRVPEITAADVLDMSGHLDHPSRNSQKGPATSWGGVGMGRDTRVSLRQSRAGDPGGAPQSRQPQRSFQGHSP